MRAANTDCDSRRLSFLLFGWGLPSVPDQRDVKASTGGMRLERMKRPSSACALLAYLHQAERYSVNEGTDTKRLTHAKATPGPFQVKEVVSAFDWMRSSVMVRPVRRAVGSKPGVTYGLIQACTIADIASDEGWVLAAHRGEGNTGNRQSLKRSRLVTLLFRSIELSEQVANDRGNRLSTAPIDGIGEVQHGVSRHQQLRCPAPSSPQPAAASR